jgi:Tfp pilus assembly protein PilZ
MFRKLRVAFESLNDFQREYQRNMANGGMFVPTEEGFEFREVIELELDLNFCDKLLLLQSEVVSRIGSALADHPGLPGVAVQFLEPIDELRHVLTEAAGLSHTLESSSPYWQRSSSSRRHPRIETRTPAQLHSEFGELSGQTENLSRSGALLAVRGEPPPVGSSVRLALVHPRTREMREVEARVVRYAKRDRSGTQIGLEFEFQEQREQDFVEELCHRELASSVAITGPIDVLGLPNLVQMFSSSTDAGTLDVWSSGEQGQIVFSGGVLQRARAGPVSGLKALSRLLAWSGGSFAFRPVAEVQEGPNEAIPMYGAILEGLQHVDELGRIDRSGFPSDARVERTAQAAPSDLEKTEQLLLDLLQPGLCVEALISQSPVFDSEAFRALISLCDRELVRITRS